jgi:hypothetical protein
MLVHRLSQIGMMAVLGSVVRSQPECAARVKMVDRARRRP